MILMDTHIWLRWILPNEPLPENHVKLINKADSLAVSSISCWEVVLLEKWNKIELPLPINEWLNKTRGQACVIVVIGGLGIGCHLGCKVSG
jgi:PIN domain nuclease of toxin-antitoxin system